jgi:hypothetical protein
MYIEDLIQLATGSGQYLFQHQYLAGNDQRILESISNQIAYNQNTLTEKQGTLVLKILKKNKDVLRTAVPTIDQDLDQPKWKTPFRILPKYKKISIERLPESTVSSIVIEFPYDEELVESFRRRNQEVHEIHKGAWDVSIKKWAFLLTERNIEWLGSVLLPRNFHAEQDFLDLYSQVSQVTREVEKYIPMLTCTNSRFALLNVHKNVPQPEATNLAEVLFWARDYGITTWDDNIEARINKELLSTTKAILYSTKKHLWFDSTKYPVEAFKDLLTYGGPAMIVVPGGSELQEVRKWVNFALSTGIDYQQISVMFRLPNEQADFNQYVKEANLNNPIDENTRLVFVSTKITKPLIKSGVRFNTVINLGYYNYMHFSMSTVVDNAQNLVYYSMKEPTKNNRWQPREL